MEQYSESFDTTNRKPHFMSLLTANYYLLHSFILSLVPNKTDAEDILQNTFMYLWEHFGDFQPGTSFISWAITIAKFQVLTYRKTKTRSKIQLSGTALDLVAAESVKLSAKMDERYEALEKCLKKLPEKELDFLNFQNFFLLSQKRNLHSTCQFLFIILEANHGRKYFFAPTH